jgi:hypothetical protein
MVYEHFSKCFIPKDPSSWFLKLFQTIVVVACGDIPKSVTLMLRANKLLAMAKDTGGLYLVVIRETFIQFINHSIVLHLQMPF